jgi:uncharacterized protein
MAPEGEGQVRASVKILIAGGPEAGKTTLVETISELAPIGAHPLAIDFGLITVDRTLRLYLFGMPGRDRYGYAWNQLVEGALGAVIVVDPRRLPDSFPVVDFFESRNLPFVVAINGFGQLPAVSVRAVRAALDLDPDIAVLHIDATNGARVKKLLLELLDIVLYRALATG